MTLWHVLDDVVPELPLVPDPAKVDLGVTGAGGVISVLKNQ